MKQYRVWGAIVVAPILAIALATVGCGGGEKKSEKPGAGSGGGNVAKESGGSGGGGKGGSTGGGLTEVPSTGTATIKGKVTFAGAQVPARKDLKPQMEAQADKDHCLKGPTESMEWIVGADKSVANVVVWLRAPSGHYFKIPDELRHRTDKVTMDQPFCAFQPHVVAINPSSYDPQTKKQVKTGQVFVVNNDAPINHNTAWKGNPLLNPGKNEILKPKNANPMTIEAKPSRDNQAGGEDLLMINCDIHKWMNARAVVLDNPYYAVTKEDGTFEIKNAPAEADVTLTWWHESMGDTLKSAKTKQIKTKPGDNTEALTVGE
jgi:hypothetical protein